MDNIQVGGREDSYDIRNYNDGITRKKVNDNFKYFYISNHKEVSNKDLERINKLGIPPAWENLWVSIDPKSKIQVVGIDMKGRKQYRYHDEHILNAEKEKFLRLYDFIKALPILEKNISSHSKLDSYNKLKVITTILKIIKLTYMRVGKEQYARENKSYGISSLKKKHMVIKGDIINFNFKGKSNQRLNYTLINNDIKSHLTILGNLEGDKLFQYIDENNKIRKITDCDINDYVQEYMGKDFTVKDFRTYAANYHFLESLLNETRKRLPKNDSARKKNIVKSLKQTAKFLKHTKNISKKSYVMNFIIDMYKNDPSYFVKKKLNNIDEVLLDLLKLYKKMSNN